MSAPVSIDHLDRVLRAAIALYNHDTGLPGGDHVTGVTHWSESASDAAKAVPFDQAAREIRRMYAERAEVAIAAADAQPVRPTAPQHAVQANEAARVLRPGPAPTDHIARIASRSAAARKAAATRKRSAAARARA